ncbi:MAG: flagellar motor protein MotB [Desulfarculaceae bacterium]|jgi:chemotaxis protein MotB
MAQDKTAQDELVASAEEAEAKAWLITYADMVTLLLTFFVMLLAISTLDQERFENVINSIQFTLGASVAPGGRMGRIDVHDVQSRSLSRPTGTEDEPLLKDLRQMVNKKNLDDVVEVVAQDGKVIMRVKGQILFPSSSSQFKGEARAVLNQVAKIVKAHPEYRLDVGGHTDPRPIKTAKFDSNWELSALRATAVLRYLIGQGVNSRRLTATGYADTDPLAPNTSEANMAKNRRVEFVLEKKER